MSDTRGTELATIETTLRERPGEYFRDEGMQARYRDLIDARTTGAPPAPAPSDGKRLAEIKAMIRDEPGRYWKSPEIQAELRALIEAGLPAAPAEEGRQAPPQRRQQVAAPAAQPSAEPAPQLADLAPTDGQRALQRTEAVMQNLEPAVAQQLESAFAGLSSTCQTALARELARPESGFVKPATADEMAGFRSLPGGRELARHWGQAAPRKIAVALESYNRVRGSLSSIDRPQFLAFWKGATAREQQLMLWQMGGS